MKSFKEYLTEAQSEEFVLQALADKDINAKIENDKIVVDKSDLTAAKALVKKIGCKRTVISGLNQ